MVFIHKTADGQSLNAQNKKGGAGYFPGTILTEIIRVVVVVTIHGLEVEVPVIALHLSQNSVEFSLRRSIHLGRRLKNRVMQKARYHSVQLPRYFRSMDLWAFVSAASSLKPSFLKSVKFDPSSVSGSC